jgi:hypothetical protein
LRGLLAIALACGCSSSPTGAIDAAPPDASPIDALPIDAPPDAVPSGTGESPWIFGMHNPGAEPLMAAAGKRGWIMFSEKVTAPTQGDGPDYSTWSNQGYGVIVRVNNGYNPDGTLPCSDQYPAFAAAVASWVMQSRGAHIWIIANETNQHSEWPTCNGAPEKITPALYVQAFTMARGAIRALPGHASDQVIPAGVSWLVDDTGAPGRTGVDYFASVLGLLGPGNFDGLALHVFTTNSGKVADVTSEEIAPGTSLHLHFRAYRDLLAVVPANARSLPVYITETDPLFTGWATAEPGWIPAVYKEIDSWNQVATNQVIRAVTIYRWPSYDAVYGIASFPAVQADFSLALMQSYRWPVR